MAEDLSAQLNNTPGCIPSKWTRSTVADGDWLQNKTLSPLKARDEWLANKIQDGDDGLAQEILDRIAGDAYLSANIDSVSSDFYSFSGKVETSAATLNDKIQGEIDRATGAEQDLQTNIDTEKSQRVDADSTLNTKIEAETTRATGVEGNLGTKIDGVSAAIDTLKAATDVIMVYGNYDAFSAASGDLIKTDNDVIKVLVDKIKFWYGCCYFCRCCVVRRNCSGHSSRW